MCGGGEEVYCWDICHAVTTRMMMKNIAPRDVSLSSSSSSGKGEQAQSNLSISWCLATRWRCCWLVLGVFCYTYCNVARRHAFLVTLAHGFIFKTRPREYYGSHSSSSSSSCAMTSAEFKSEYSSLGDPTPPRPSCCCCCCCCSLYICLQDRTCTARRRSVFYSRE